jgi:hypothetical protein
LCNSETIDFELQNYPITQLPNLSQNAMSFSSSIEDSFHKPSLPDAIAINAVEANARRRFQRDVPFFSGPWHVPPIAGCGPWAGGCEHLAMAVPQAYEMRCLMI